MELPDLPEAYSPLILPGFNEEENITQMTDEGDKNATKVDNIGTSNERVFTSLKGMIFEVCK